MQANSEIFYAYSIVEQKLPFLLPAEFATLSSSGAGGFCC